MANQSRKKHTLNPIIILSFIVIGLLFVILTISLKENLDINGSLRAGSYICSPKSEYKNVTGSDYIPLTTTAPANLSELKSKASDRLKDMFCFGEARKDANQLPCTDPKCESKYKDEITDYPNCSASITEITDNFTTPQPSPGTSFTVTYTAKLRARLTRTCVPKESTTPTPAVYPQCIPSGSLANKCDPNSEGFFKVDSFKQATVTDEFLNTPQLIALATEQAIEAAKKGLAVKCAALATNDPMYQCTNILIAKGISNRKGCVTGCEPNNKSVYKAPYTQIDVNGDPITDPPVRTAPQCKTGIVATATHSVTMSATCYAACNYTQDCVPIDTPVPTPVTSTPTPTGTSIR